VPVRRRVDVLFRSAGNAKRVPEGAMRSGVWRGVLAARRAFGPPNATVRQPTLGTSRGALVARLGHGKLGGLGRIFLLQNAKCKLQNAKCKMDAPRRLREFSIFNFQSFPETLCGWESFSAFIRSHMAGQPALGCPNGAPVLSARGQRPGTSPNAMGRPPNGPTVRVAGTVGLLGRQGHRDHSSPGRRLGLGEWQGLWRTQRNVSPLTARGCRFWIGPAVGPATA
jgi:hypothetical protein